MPLQLFNPDIPIGIANACIDKVPAGRNRGSLGRLSNGREGCADNRVGIGNHGVVVRRIGEGQRQIAGLVILKNQHGAVIASVRVGLAIIGNGDIGISIAVHIRDGHALHVPGVGRELCLALGIESVVVALAEENENRSVAVLVLVVGVGVLLEHDIAQAILVEVGGACGLHVAIRGVEPHLRP